MEETIYLQEANCLVTSNRVEINGQTFAVRNIGSVKVTSRSRPWLGLLTVLVGIASMPAGNYFFSVPVLAIGAYLTWKTVAERNLVLISGGGEQLAMRSTDGGLIERLRAAIAQAISVR